MVILEKPVAKLSEATLERFVLRARRAAGVMGLVTVWVTSGDEIRNLNRKYRGKPKTTDVLSFPSSLAPLRPKHFAGDIAISADMAVKNAARLGHSAAKEIKILTLHGILHLAGFDHERDNGKMARKEERLRREFRLPSGLIERSHPPASRSARPAAKSPARRAR